MSDTTESAPSIDELVAAKRESVDALRQQIKDARKGENEVVTAAEGVRKLSLLQEEEDRLRAELAEVQAGVVAEQVVPTEPAVEQSVPAGATGAGVEVTPKTEDAAPVDSAPSDDEPVIPEASAASTPSPSSPPPPPPSSGSSSSSGRFGGSANS